MKLEQKRKIPMMECPNFMTVTFQIIIDIFPERLFGNVEILA